MASALTEDPAQQQAMIAAMLSQLPPEHQTQIQEAVGNYSHQLTAQGVPAEQLQQYIWSYYTQCVTTFFAQLPAEIQQAVMASQAAPSPPQEEPQRPQAQVQEQQAECQPEELRAEPNTVAQPEQAEASGHAAPQQDSGPQAGNAEPLRLLSEQESQALQAELQAVEMRKQQEAQQMRKQQEELETQQAQEQQELKEQQQQFASKLQQKMDPALAARFAKPRETQVGDSSPAGGPSQKKLDPVLAKRWNAMQERQAAGEDAAKSIDERMADLAKSRQDKPESEFAKKMAKRAEKVAEGADPAVSPRSQALEAKKSQGGDSELKKLMAKQQEKNRERLETGESPAKKQHEFNSTTGELAQKLAKAQERQEQMEGEAGDSGTAQDLGSANGKDNNVADQKRFTLPRGQTAVHTYTWPTSSSVSVTNLKWSASVLDELTVDLEVAAVLKPVQEGDALQTVVLTKNARGGDHWGSLAPARDRRLPVVADTSCRLPVDGDVAGTENSEGKTKHREVQSVVFTFSNSFSWFTAKEVEFETVCEWCHS